MTDLHKIRKWREREEANASLKVLSEKKSGIVVERAAYGKKLSSGEVANFPAAVYTFPADASPVFSDLPRATCGICGGNLYYLATPGGSDIYRCEDCGVDYYRSAGE